MRGDGAVPEYPPTGVMIHYYLAEAAASNITLEILDRSGNALQTFSSDTTKVASGDEDNLMRPSGESLAKPLAKAAGMNRFIWDMRYPDPRPLKGAGNAEGPVARPGKYQVRMSTGNFTQTQTFDLMMDPRVTEDEVTVAEVEEQFRLNLAMASRLTELRTAVLTIRLLRNQLDELIATDKNRELTKKAKAASVKLTEIEEALVQTKDGKVGAQLKPKLNRQLTYLYGMTTRADQKPGRDAHQRFKDIEKILADHLSTLEHIVSKDLAKLNRDLEKQGMLPVKAPTTEIETGQ